MSEEVQYWFTSGRNAIINRRSLKPIENKWRKGKPLSSQKGQAEAFFLIDDAGKWWILKKFHGNCNLGHKYLMKISILLPKEDGFACGTQTQVLSRGTLWKTGGYHYSKDLDRCSMARFLCQGSLAMTGRAWQMRYVMAK